MTKIKKIEEESIPSVYINPSEINGKIFKRFLKLAEIRQLTLTEMETYKRSLKQSYQIRDIADCARIEGKMEGVRENVKEGRMQIAVKLLQRKTPIEDVIFLTELTKEQVQELAKGN